MTTLDQFATDKLARLEAGALRRRLRPTARAAGAVLERDGQRLISFSCNDYLNLSTHPAVIDAAIDAARRHGAGAGASRLVTGDHPLYCALEARLAALKQTEDAVVFGSGFLANTGIIPALMAREDAIFVDELAHACIWAGARLSGAALHVFRHNDLAHLAELLAAHRQAARHAMVVTDGVFSMDGDLAPVGEMLALAKAHDAWLMTDDAHGIGVINEGRGSAHGHDVPLQMGTLSKAVGSYGGYLCASHVVCELIRNRARSFVYTTGLPPAVVGASIAALDLIATDPAMCAAPLAHARRFCAALGLPPAESPIVPLLLGTAERALAAQAVLEAAGFLVAAIRPPTVPEGTARLRFAFTACHAPDDIDRLAQLVHDRILVTA
ncbi:MULTISPECIES: 8-amino-7-oxononanoate synthase [Acidiphilium]|jgi:8-amino-7-oxononanoate synthase|uniref:8-amino-7-ketopelargonate synthase n=1 Tax=Acidiphilium multivorum (strain DSM 11245 / JCM 8867 / NBRC 100883 / AIU 301) TaxID=926570 RepID=F0J096_ACIMA|nr:MULTISPECIES: 8-amino-7-oxononanoate synthase [Acidiphilium]MBS3023212.1 8-amino-7-oxononanoate synthase [Acidiphilium multivorum]BAJ81456.1 8-amino-7-oxononanoate synthase [Acidiphilium multivorum AIU301]GAN73900.1 alpha-oxoamine synthase/8-amino-7-oxononanoate synthase [Acidiphilium multivorum AIU301]